MFYTAVPALPVLTGADTLLWVLSPSRSFLHTASPVVLRTYGGVPVFTGYACLHVLTGAETLLWLLGSGEEAEGSEAAMHRRNMACVIAQQLQVGGLLENELSTINVWHSREELQMGGR